MKILMKMLSVLLLVFCGSALAQNDISGTWGGRLEIAPGQEMTVRFVITKDDNGSYKAVLSSPDEGAIRNVPASGLEYTGDRLTIEVDSLSGSFSGNVSKNIITGEWKQPGSTLPLVLTMYEKPSTNTIQQLLGEWYGTFTLPNGNSYTNVLRFTKENGQISATSQVVGQGEQRYPVNDILFKGNQVSFLITAGPLGYKGVLGGKKITGTATLGTTEMAMNFTKGKYIEPGIDMPAEDIKRLEGQWVGKEKTSTGVMVNNIWKFERNEAGRLKASTRSPERGSRTAKLIDLVLNEDRLSFKLQGVDKTFSGKVNNNTITGFSTYRGKDTEVTMTRGAKIELTVPRIDIPDETMKKLLGRWNGNIGTTLLVVRFERNAKGDAVIYFDLPQRGSKNLPVLKASFTEGKLCLKIPDSEYNGSLGDNKIDGIWKDGEQSYPLVLAKE